MNQNPKCPQCGSENTYHDGEFWVCPDCSHEWNPADESASAAHEGQTPEVRDAYGNVLADGDTVALIKDLKVKGSAAGLKSGTKVKNIRIVDAEDGHNILCRIENMGSMNLKSEFVKKV